MRRIAAIVSENFEGRDVEIIAERLKGDMTPERYTPLVRKHGISVERIRQIQRGALAMIRDALVRDGVESLYS